MKAAPQAASTEFGANITQRSKYDAYAPLFRWQEDFSNML